ncbi:MAG: aminotransferase class V-fold PLP-dependent enzyme [Myxococcales bacterium]|nr:aminotransferase class V-fold PLP-dependent enzyme [Myxococcales bacterium]
MTSIRVTLRASYPLLSKKTYLATHSMGLPPESARDALASYFDTWSGSGIGAWDGPFPSAVDQFCRDIEALLQAPPQSVVPAMNVTHAMSRVASCFDFRGARRRIVLTNLEFTTTYPLWRGCERLGAEVVVVRSRDGMSIELEDLLSAIDERTAVVPIGHAFFRSGALQDLSAIAARAHEVGAFVLADGYQSAGSVPVDVTANQVDFYVGGCHKWLCGGAGAGYLYVNPSTTSELLPRFRGWFGLANPFSYELDVVDDPKPPPTVSRFMGGTANVPAIHAAREGLKRILEIGVDTIRAHSERLTTKLVDGVLERGFALTSPRLFSARNGMVCFDFPGADDLKSRLAEADIVVDWRPACGFRVSPHFYNDDQDIERFFSVLDRLRKR